MAASQHHSITASFQNGKKHHGTQEITFILLYIIIYNNIKYNNIYFDAPLSNISNKQMLLWCCDAVMLCGAFIRKRLTSVSYFCWRYSWKGWHFLYSLTFAAPKFGVLFVLHYLCSVFHRYSVLMDIVFWCVFFSFPFCSWEQKENPFRNFLFFIALHVNVGRLFFVMFLGCLLTYLYLCR